MTGKNGIVDLESFLAGTADGVCAIGSEGIILAWNASAERILGYPAREAVGKTCREIFDGRDIAGNSTCSEFCTVRAHAKRCQPVQHFQFQTRTRNGDPVWLDVSIVFLGGNSPVLRVHLFRDVTANHQMERILREKLALPVLSGPPPQQELTSRESEILHLMKEGATTEAIAERLYISRATVRNHIQNTFMKLEVHNRLEAVAVANRCGL